MWAGGAMAVRQRWAVPVLRCAPQRAANAFFKCMQCAKSDLLGGMATLPLSCILPEAARLAIGCARCARLARRRAPGLCRLQPCLLMPPSPSLRGSSPFPLCVTHLLKPVKRVIGVRRTWQVSHSACFYAASRMSLSAAQPRLRSSAPGLREVGRKEGWLAGARRPVSGSGPAPGARRRCSASVT